MHARQGRDAERARQLQAPADDERPDRDGGGDGICYCGSGKYRRRQAGPNGALALFERKRGKRGQAVPSGSAGAPVVPRPASAPQVSRWPDGWSVVPSSVAPSPKAGHDAAAWVVDRGRATSAERVAVMDNRTGEIVHAGTKGLAGNFWLDFVSAPAERDAYAIRHTQAARRYPPRIFGYWPTQVLGRCTRTTATLRGFPPGSADGTHRCQCPQKHKGIERVYAEADKRTQTLLQWLADQDKITPEQGRHL